MARHGTLSRRPAKEQPPADMLDYKTANTTADHTHIPLPSLAPSIPCPVSDHVATAVPVGALRRSSPAISIIQSHTLLTPTLLTFMCTQVLWCLARLARPRASGVTMAPDIRLTILSTRVHSQVLSLLLTSFLSLGVPVQRTT